MKLPEGIKGKNKIKDAKICALWLENTLTNKEIADKFNISERTVGRIVYRNSAVLKINKEYEKHKRIKQIERLIAKKGDNSNKDIADLIDQLRVEHEGQKIDHGGLNLQSIVIVRANESRATEDKPEAVARQVTI